MGNHPSPIMISQGCPLYPILATIILNHILKKVDMKLRALSTTCNTPDSDNGMCGLTISLTYVTNINFLVPLEDGKPLLNKFNNIAEPLGVIMIIKKNAL